MDCELCGKHALDAFLISIDGARMTVCSRCSKHGVFIKKIEPTQAMRENAVLEETELEFSPDFSSRVRKARESLQISQEDFARKINETVMVIKKIEAGKMKPTEKLASRIEHFLNIKLFEQAARGEKDLPEAKKPRETTLGDVIVIKKK